ncbi:unnamed protein product [Sphagnum tenellum]
MCCQEDTDVLEICLSEDYPLYVEAQALLEDEMSPYKKKKRMRKGSEKGKKEQEQPEVLRARSYQGRETPENKPQAREDYVEAQALLEDEMPPYKKRKRMRKGSEKDKEEQERPEVLDGRSYKGRETPEDKPQANDPGAVVAVIAVVAVAQVAEEQPKDNVDEDKGRLQKPGVLDVALQGRETPEDEPLAHDPGVVVAVTQVAEERCEDHVAEDKGSLQQPNVLAVTLQVDGRIDFDGIDHPSHGGPVHVVDEVDEAQDERLEKGKEEQEPPEVDEAQDEGLDKGKEEQEPPEVLQVGSNQGRETPEDKSQAHDPGAVVAVVAVAQVAEERPKDHGDEDKGGLQQPNVLDVALQVDLEGVNHPVVTKRILRSNRDKELVVISYPTCAKCNIDFYKQKQLDKHIEEHHNIH